MGVASNRWLLATPDGADGPLLLRDVDELEAREGAEDGRMVNALDVRFGDEERLIEVDRDARPLLHEDRLRVLIHLGACGLIRRAFGLRDQALELVVLPVGVVEIRVRREEEVVPVARI